MNYYNEIKEQIINNEITKKVKDYSKNRSDLETYYNIGKILSKAGKHYGKGIIKEYSIKLTKEFGRGYSTRNLWLMLNYYIKNEKMQTVSAQLTWSHYCELLSFDSIDKINYYIKITVQYNLSVRELRKRKKNNIYELDIFIGDISKHNKGIGQLVINKVCGYLFDNNAKEIIMTPLKSNEKAINCYKKCGFIIEKEYVDKDTIGNEQVYVLLKKSINH